MYSWLSRLKKPQLAEYLRNRCLFSRVKSWLIITVTEPKFLNLNYLWMGKKKLFSTCPIRNYLGKIGKRKLFKHCSTAGIKLNQRILKNCWFDENALDYSHVLRGFCMSDSQMFLSSHGQLGLFYNDIKMSTNVSYRSVLYGKLYQGHPATIFCKITVRRSKSDCLEISKAWEKLKIYGSVADLGGSSGGSIEPRKLKKLTSKTF